jgi:hypothetical protein
MLDPRAGILDDASTTTTGKTGRHMVRMTFRLPSKALLIAACALGLFALAAPAMANPYFMEKTGRNCGFCHNEGEEKMKPTAQHLTQTRREFYLAFREDHQKAIRQFS